jgi:hypothetical protein
MAPTPIPAETLQGIVTLNILGHGIDAVGEVGGLDVDTLFKVIAGGVSAKMAAVTTAEEKRAALRTYWQLREINLVSCNSASSRGGDALNIASLLTAKLQRLTGILGFNIVVRGVDGFATVSDRGDILNVPRDNYKPWTADLARLQQEARGSGLTLREVSRRNQELLDTYSTGVRDHFVEHRTT